MNHDTQLSAAGYDFRIRVYRAEASNGSIMVWSHGGAFMFGTLEMPEADAVARALADRGSTVVETTIVREAGELHGFLNEPARASFSRTVAGIADFLVKRRPFDRPLL